LTGSFGKKRGVLQVQLDLRRFPKTGALMMRPRELRNGLPSAGGLQWPAFNGWTQLLPPVDLGPTWNLGPTAECVDSLRGLGYIVYYL
jgi:hypothetical protein